MVTGIVSSSGRRTLWALLERAARGLRQEESEQRAGQERGRKHQERGPEAEAGGQKADHRRRGRAQAAAHVVAEAHRGGADLGREQLRRDRAEAGEEAGPEERDEGAKD